MLQEIFPQCGDQKFAGHLVNVESSILQLKDSLKK